MELILRFFFALILAAIVLSSGCGRANSAPVINSLEAGNGCIMPSSDTAVKCIASDSDGDSLTYSWSVSGGTLSGTGEAVTWWAPDVPGNYTVNVTVSDGKGETTDGLTLSVRVNNPPVIASLTAQPPTVEEGKTTIVTCAATDSDGDTLVYRWSATRGNLTGEGAQVTWLAPMSCATYTVTVEVSDSCGSVAKQNLPIVVESG